MNHPPRGGKSYAAALAYALSLTLKGSAVEPPKQKKPTFTERRKAEKRKRK